MRSGQLSDEVQEERVFFAKFLKENAALARSFEDKMTLSFLIPDQLDRYRVQRKILLAEVQKLDFQSGLSLLQKYSELGEVVLGPVMAYFCEEKPRSKEEHEQAVEFLKNRIEVKLEETGKIAGLSAAEAFGYEYFSSGEELLLAGLASASDERAFKGFLYDKWIQRIDVKLKDYSPFYRSNYLWNWIMDLDVAYIEDEIACPKPSLVSVIRLFYSLDAVGRGIFVRRCLVGKKGVLGNKASARRLVEGFFDSRIEWSGHESLSKLMKEIFGAFIETADIKEQYQILGPLLAENFMVPPSKPYEYTELARERAEEYVKTQAAGYRTKLERPDQNAWSTVRQYYEKLQKTQDARLAELRADAPGIENALKLICWKAVDEVSQKLLNLMLGKMVKFEEYSEEMKKERAGGVDELFGLEREKRDAEERMDPLEVVFYAGKTLLPIGIRFLQNLRQYVEIPKEYWSAFDKFLDEVFGQNRLSFYSTFKRESGRDEINGNYFDEVSAIGRRLGGGSLVSVYETVNVAGETGVLKVNNPNVLYRAEAAIKIVYGVVNHLAGEHPERAAVYEAVKLLLDDLLDWIVRDVNDRRFYGNDVEIAKRYDGYSNGGAFNVKILKHRELSGQCLKAEELVDGHNLTHIKISGQEPPADSNRMVSVEEYKDIVCLYAQLYLDMVLSGPALSNLTRGNVRVTPDNQLAILDRNMYLEFDAADIGFFKDLVRSFKVPSKIVEITTQYLAGLPRNKEKSGRICELKETLKELLEGEKLDWETVLFKILAEIKAHGFKLPLRFTLHIINIKELNGMAAQAGFNSLLECLMYRYNQPLMAKLIGVPIR